MSAGRLTDLQVRVLQLLADVEPGWTLIGGAALAGFHTRHRDTRDLDLLWSARAELGELRRIVGERLRAAGLEVTDVQTAPAFARLRVAADTDAIVVDLIAEPFASSLPPDTVALEGTAVRVASRREILSDKLCALLERAELRDLEDVRVLLGEGSDLGQGLTDAPRKDAGFSPLTLAWVLEGLPVARLAAAIRLDTAAAARLERFRDELVSRLVQTARPRE